MHNAKFQIFQIYWTTVELIEFFFQIYLANVLVHVLWNSELFSFSFLSSQNKIKCSIFSENVWFCVVHLVFFRHVGERCSSLKGFAFSSGGFAALAFSSENQQGKSWINSIFENISKGYSKLNSKRKFLIFYFVLKNIWKYEFH